ncbi:MAG: protein-disulfide reductase DsbD family protein [Boseongicola sp.]|nr:protein-disulfide reductase DsbD family protein [Boseongicola sp.]MDD9976387.1 protein-disulfide reductase DsbD family protein [Boseongicola sp.]
MNSEKAVAIRLGWNAIRVLALLTCWISVSLPETTQAAESDVFENPALTARLISAEDGIAPNSGTVSLGLVLNYAEGWKGYWRTPGEVGLAPEVSWADSTNLSSAEILWPAPERFEAFGIENFGYSGEVILPIRATLSGRGNPLDLRSKITLLTCSDVCVPHSFELTLDLPTGTGIDQTSANAIAAFAARVPATAEESDIEITTVAVDAKSTELFVTAESDRAFKSVDVFPEFGPQATFGKPDIRLSQDRLSFWARIPVHSWSNDEQTPLVTVTDKDRAVTVPVVLSTEIPAPPYETAPLERRKLQLATIVVIGFLGGMILNVMPCVLPVLSIKLASVMKVNGRSQRVIRNGFLFSAFGVLTFVWLLALMVLGLKWIGVSVGWGIQFQNPFFVGLMFIVVAMFSANLFGLFEFALPRVVQDRLGAGSTRTGYSADFGTGLLAAVLATPCSAPLLGTAITFALAGKAIDVFVVFTALGLGLASPYLLVAARPNLVERLPRPGHWMLLVKAGLGLLLLVTAAWLLFVLIGLAGLRVTTIIAASTAVIIFLLTAKLSNPTIRHGLIVASLAISLISIGTLTSQSKTEVASDLNYWQAFEPQEIARHVSEGHTVFVDVTADWCLTCKANKTLVLDREPVVDRLEDAEIVAMQADWTRPNEDISRFLERHGRYGIPFNIVFGPGAPSGIALPEVLTKARVMEAIDEASSATVGAEVLTREPS